MEHFSLTDDMTICRLLNGMWQVSGAHGSIDREAALEQMHTYHEAGFTTWDLADHYGPAEDLIGEFRTQLGERKDEIEAFTKWVPRPGPMPRDTVEQAIDRSRRRMQTDSLDMLQFHWWTYRDKRYLDALNHLADLRDEGRIRHLGLTNFDTERVQEIAESGIRIISNQVQYSLVDMRPAQKMTPFCQENDIHLLTYGTLCGGLLSERYLNQPKPTQLDTASLRKYMRMVDVWGGWALFQELLAVLKVVADKHGVSIANIATRAILDQPGVAGVIIGVRLGMAEHIEENARVFDISLEGDDWQQIRAVQERSNDLMARIGDCGDEYR